MSTLGAARMDGYVAVFSGKLSSVTTHCENPEQGNPPEAVPAPRPDEREVGGPEVGGPEVGGPEVGGRDGPEPTRFGDWELRGRCIDF
jgi:hypothetical protein